MTDLSSTIAPKSDQLNADDLIAGPKTVRVTKVSACPGSAEQPIAIYFEGDNNKPYKPCKSMRRVLVQVWGKDGNAYAGRAMTLFRDSHVQFGGVAVGGIRISHMSHIEAPVTLALTATRASRKPYTVQPLAAESPRSENQTLGDRAKRLTEALRKAPSVEKIRAIWTNAENLRAELAASDRATLEEIERLYDARSSELSEVK